MPVGYLRPKRGARLELDPVKAPVIRDAFVLRAAGAPLRDVVAFLDERLPGGPSGRGGGWAWNTVIWLLRNPVYVGEARNGVHRLQEAHPPVVSRETFNTVQALRHSRPARSGMRNLLAGVARCGSCGYALGRKVSPAATSPTGARTGALARARSSVMAPALDGLVTEIVLEKLDGFDIEQVPVGADVDVDQLRLFEGNVTVHTVRDVWSALTVDERREVIWAGVEAVTVTRAVSRDVPLTDRVAVYWKGDQLPL